MGGRDGWGGRGEGKGGEVVGSVIVIGVFFCFSSWIGMEERLFLGEVWRGRKKFLSVVRKWEIGEREERGCLFD